MTELQATAQREVGDPIPHHCEVIEIHVADMRQLFNSIDPSPFRQRDLDADAEEFIVGWARDSSRKAHLALLVHLDQPANLEDELAILREAVRTFFEHRRESTRRQLRELLRVGRTSLMIGMVVVTAAIVGGSFIPDHVPGHDILRESLLIGGWVAMWRPLEIFLYEWWPIQAQARLYKRLSEMPVRITRP